MIAILRSILSYAPTRIERVLSLAWHGMKCAIPFTVPKRYEWSIGIYRGQSPFHFEPAEGPMPILTKHDITDVLAGYVADPFVIRLANTWYMLFEIANLESKKGEIGLAISEDGLKWDYKHVVLNEAFHLSYPYVFEWQGEIFMVPESQESKSIRLYKADPFPSRWSFVATLVTGQAYVDPSLVRFREKWWMFSASKSAGSSRTEDLHLFVADNLIGPWQEHPSSPVVRKNAKIARPAGRVINFEGKLFRYAQDCAQIYGRQVHAFEITELTQDRYAERMVSCEPIVKAAKGAWNEMGMHHIDPHQLADGSWLACVDGKRLVSVES